MSSLDAASAVLVREAALMAQREWGAGLVIASHDLTWLYEVSDQVLHLQQGRPASRTPVNLLWGEWRETMPGGEWRSDLGDGQALLAPAHPAHIDGQTPSRTGSRGYKSASPAAGAGPVMQSVKGRGASALPGALQRGQPDAGQGGAVVSHGAHGKIAPGHPAHISRHGYMAVFQKVSNQLGIEQLVSSGLWLGSKAAEPSPGCRPFANNNSAWLGTAMPPAMRNQGSLQPGRGSDPHQILGVVGPPCRWVLGRAYESSRDLKSICRAMCFPQRSHVTV